MGRSVIAVMALGIAVLPLIATTTEARSARSDERTLEAIGYFTKTPSNKVERLAAAIRAGKNPLSYDARFGYLPSLLRTLGINTSTQSMVFSKTSLQIAHITPSNPRALYFSDDIYIGYIPGSDIVEVSVADPVLGGVFYTFKNQGSGAPTFNRHTYECLQCHDGALTNGVPGHTVRSVHPYPDGQVDFSSGTHIVSDTTPHSERFGGWWVTGKHLALNHEGNAFVRGSGGMDNPLRANRTPEKLPVGMINLKDYIAGTSDVVAQLILQHQTVVHNRITAVTYGTTLALADDASIGEALGNKPGELLGSTLSRIRNSCDTLLDTLFFVDEAPLPAPIDGDKRTIIDFVKQGPRDPNLQTLRQLDLRTRLFRYRLSFLVHSAGFKQMPIQARSYCWIRIKAALASATDPLTGKLEPSERKTIHEILVATEREYRDAPAKFSDWKPVGLTAK
ncbi:MAG: hypothetical protein ACKO14_02940 [Armatimonadota bacterium]